MIRSAASASTVFLVLALAGWQTSLGATKATVSVAVSEGKATIRSKGLSIQLDASTGTIYRLTNRLTGLSITLAGSRAPCCALILNDGRCLAPSGEKPFELSSKKGACKLSFNFDTVGCEVDIAVSEGPAAGLAFRMVLQDREGSNVKAVVFPILSGITTLGPRAEDDYLAHPSAGGLLISNPLENLRPDRVDHYRERFEHSEYPDGFYGCPLQFMTLYDSKKGGFYFACHDPTNTAKELNFFAPRTKRYLDMNFVSFLPGTLRGQAGPRPRFRFPIVIAPVKEGSWYEAANIYRRWATSGGPGAPSWCRNGPKRNQPEALCARWLQERVGVATFGLSCRKDQSRWLTALHEHIRAPALHILGFDWETIDNSASDAGYEDWERHWVNPANVAAIRKNGDYLALFKVDMWLSTAARDYTRLGSADTGHHFVDGGRVKAWMCPASDVWSRFYIWRDKMMVSSADVRCDALYNDISVCNAAPLSCLNEGHNHPVGGKGGWIIEAYRRLLQRSHNACSKVRRGRRVPIGTEVIIENLIDVVDFCHSRAMAGVQGAFEWAGDPAGKTVKIPMFDYVYHEYGPVRIDGFAKLSRRFGDIFYLIAARTYLWGALLELNYEFSAPERFEGLTGPTYYVSYDSWLNLREESHPLPACSDYLAFLRRMITARLRFGRDFLCWGKMVRPLALRSAVPKIALAFNHFNVFPGHDTARSGVVWADAVVSSAWRYKDRLGFFFANISKKNLTIECAFDPSEYDFPPQYLLLQRSRLKAASKGKKSGKTTIHTQVPARDVILLEIRPLTGRPGRP